MKLRGNKHWDLLTDNEKPCECGRTTRIAMVGKDKKNKGILLCKRCALRWNEVERCVGDEVKALLTVIRGHLISWAVILGVGVALNIVFISHFTRQDHRNTVEILTEWAYPKTNLHMSKFQVRETIEAHCKYSIMPEHTLAIVMAESRFFPGAINTVTQDKKSSKYQDVLGQGQIRATVWGRVLREQGIIENDDRDLFDIVVTAKSVSYILNHYMDLIPDDLRTPGIKIVYALTMYNGHMKGKAAMRGLAERNAKLSNDELRKIIAELDYPVEVLAYVGEMSALRQDTNIIKQIRALFRALLHKKEVGGEGPADAGSPLLEKTD